MASQTSQTSSSVDVDSSSHAVHLRSVDPSPIEDDDATTPNDKSTSPSTSKLGLGSHSVPYYLHRAQRYSSYAFTFFAAMHITNTAVLPLLTPNLQSASSYLLLTRPYYQTTPLAEPLVVFIPLATHILSGLALRLYHRRQALQRSGAISASERARTPWPSLSGTQALGLWAALLVPGHALLSRGLPRFVQGSSAGVGLDYVGHGVALHGKWLGAALYAWMTAVVGVHVVWGWAKWVRLSPEYVGVVGKGVGESEADRRVRRKRRWWGINAVAAAVVGVWIAGGVGVVVRAGRVEGWVGKQYDEIYRAIPIIGKWV